MPIVFKLAVHPGAKADLARLWDEDAESAGILQATLQQIAADPRLLDHLTTRDFGAHGVETFHVSQWLQQQRGGRNLWRLKVWELEGKGRRYRVIYALDPRASRYCVLGIFSRDFDYDIRDPRTQRVIAAYDALGIPSYR